MVWILVAIGVYLGALCGIAWVSLHPFRTPLFISPASLGMPQEDLVIPSTDGIKLAAWWSEAPGAKTVAVLAHGYVMNRSELTPVAYWLWQRGISCLLLDFRAHGYTRGGASTIGWKEADDVAAAVDQARRLAPGAKVLIIGSSMGSAAAAFALSRETSADALLLDSCYSRLVQASFGWWRFLGGKLLSILLGPTVLLAGPFAGINPFKVDVALALRKVSTPTLLLHGRCDTLALPGEAERNLASLNGNGRLVWFENCGHSEFRWVQSDRFYAEVREFLIEQGMISTSLADEVSVKLQS